MGERTFIRVPKFNVVHVTRHLDSDGVITGESSTTKKLVGKPVEEMLYLKYFQHSGRSLVCGLTGLQRDVLDFICNQVRDSTNEFVLIQSEVVKYTVTTISRAAYYTAIKALNNRQLIYKVSDCRYVLNPYYAAVGSNNEVKELRQWWDETHKIQPTQTKE
jgi:hypothetical protein